MNRDTLQIQNALLEQQIKGLTKQILIMQEQIKYLMNHIDNLERTYITCE